jgi:tRNA A-37 threonylcarbamoyl transferase component Bud32
MVAEKGYELIKLAREAVAAACAGMNSGDFPEVFSSLPGFDEAYPLQSRQGRCFEVRFENSPSLFVKILETIEKADNERHYSGLVSSTRIACPAMLAWEGRIIARGFINGRTAADELDLMKKDGDQDSSIMLCAKLGEILGRVHRIKADATSGIVVNDLNLRNFIVSPNEGISLIDLADAGEGDQARDIGALLVHILTHRPVFTALSWLMADAAFHAYVGAFGQPPGRRDYCQGLQDALTDAALRRKDSSLYGEMEAAALHMRVWEK